MPSLRLSLPCNGLGLAAGRVEEPCFGGYDIALSANVWKRPSVRMSAENKDGSPFYPTSAGRPRLSGMLSD
jgi:hypothetical protein